MKLASIINTLWALFLRKRSASFERLSALSHAQLNSGSFHELPSVSQPWQEGSVTVVDGHLYMIGGLISDYSYTPLTFLSRA